MPEDPLATYLVRVTIPAPETEDLEATRDAPSNRELEELIVEALAKRNNFKARVRSERTDK